MRLLILSDIHGNLTAFKSVLEKAEAYKPEACVLLGDIIDYGMHSNEVIEVLRKLSMPVLCNISGNHEYAVKNNDFSRFSSQRGIESAKYTRDSLSGNSLDYLENQMSASGTCEFMADTKKCLAVHGKSGDEYWGSITPDVEAGIYAEYDFVFSGHSHVPHFFEKFVKTDDPVMRNKKKIIFINPGSVGQPRNHNNKAQFAVLDTLTEEAVLCKAEYDIKSEQAAFCGQNDIFYKERLGLGV